MRVPHWLKPIEPPPSKVPDWLDGIPPVPKMSKERKALMFVEFDLVFPRVLDMMCAGSTLANALRSLPIEIDKGAFAAWLYKDSTRKQRYSEAKEIRSEAWTGEMLRHALGEDEDGVAVACDLDRSKFIVDTYKFFVSRENRKVYGDTKTIEMNTTISITAAMADARQRVIDVSVVDDDIDLMDNPSYKQLVAPVVDDDGDDE